jgi:hypothetical protein
MDMRAIRAGLAAVGGLALALSVISVAQNWGARPGDGEHGGVVVYQNLVLGWVGVAVSGLCLLGVLLTLGKRK